MRIEELYNILLSDKPSNNLRKKEKELFEMVPEFEKCKGFNQNCVWHVYDVFEHILHAVDNAPSDLNVRLAALFHDVGKPAKYTVDRNGNGHFLGHWEVSQKVFEDFADKYNIDKKLRDRVSNLIYYHDLWMVGLEKNTLDKIYNLLGPDGIRQLYCLKKADALASTESYHSIVNYYDEQLDDILSKYDSENRFKR